MMPMTTPISAVSSGSPAAASDPNVIRSTSPATARPMSSPTPPIEASDTTASPPNSTCRPASRAVSAAAWTASAEPSGSASACAVQFTCASATRPSSDVSGSLTERHAGRLRGGRGGVGDGRGPGSVRQPFAFRRGEHDPAGRAVGFRQPLLEQVDRPLGFGAGHRGGVGGGSAQRRRPPRTCRRAARARRRASPCVAGRPCGRVCRAGWPLRDPSFGEGCPLTIGVAARRDDGRKRPLGRPLRTHPVPPLGGRAADGAGLRWAACRAAPTCSGPRSRSRVSLAVLRLGTPDPTQNDRAPDLLGALLAIAACAPLAVRRAHPLAAAVVALPFAGAALALGYLVIPAVLVGLVLCSLAAVLSAQRVTIPLAALRRDGDGGGGGHHRRGESGAGAAARRRRDRRHGRADRRRDPQRARTGARGAGVRAADRRAARPRRRARGRRGAAADRPRRARHHRPSPERDLAAGGGSEPHDVGPGGARGAASASTG